MLPAVYGVISGLRFGDEAAGAVFIDAQEQEGDGGGGGP